MPPNCISTGGACSATVVCSRGSGTDLCGAACVAFSNDVLNPDTCTCYSPNGR